MRIITPVIVLFIYALTLTSMLQGQQERRLVFEVTSVKENKLPVGQRGPAMECSPGGRFVAHGLSLRPILIWAYHLQFFQLSEVPPSVNDAIFDIEAKAAGPVTQDECRQMVQALLADRFKMSIRRETKNFAVYALVVAKEGLKMTKITEGMKDPGVGLTVNGVPYPGPRSEGWSMERLTEALGSAAIAPDRPVVDRTGLQEYYKVSLDITIGSTDLFTAARRLGLRAEERKEPFEMIIIDRMIMPDEN